MGKTIIISNRLPVTVKKDEDNISYHPSIGGLATGLDGIHKESNSIWIGWPGITTDDVTPKDRRTLTKDLREIYNCKPVYLSDHEMELFYYGFCNMTIWPLFHYFVNKVEYDLEMWEMYQEVNQKFFDAVKPVIEDGDMVWVHDYQLLLLPRMIKSAFPNTKVGFFLHIPFPSFEIFRLLVWRDEILTGMLGADLIGFHTYDYVRHFLSSVRRLLGFENNLNHISCEDRYVSVDAFPMGIDYNRFTMTYNTPEFQNQVKQIISSKKGEKMLLSVDRLDYTKGIPERIRAFDTFLTKYPEYREKVRFQLIVAPSRVAVDSYADLRSEITELVSEINGKHGTVNWMPIWYFFQSFSQEGLIALYKYSDVLLVTPLRDGMNLVAKEYIAARTDYKGMVVISETAGAASEIGEVVVVNANDIDEIAEGIKTALEMPVKEKTAINKSLHKRLKRYNVSFWAQDFMNNLDKAGEIADQTAAISLEKDNSVIINAYKKAKKRIIFLDYDGTLVGFKALPEQARPDPELKRMLFDLIDDPKNKLVIVSGRDRYTLEDWLGDLRINMLAGHGLWRRELDGEWIMTVSLDNSWKKAVTNMLQVYCDRMPGALIEEKDYSIAFHYRQCEPDMVSKKMSEVWAALSSMTQSMSLTVQEGNKVLEVKDMRVDKGQSSLAFLNQEQYDFILGVGDDHTDEDLFVALPKKALTVKVGIGMTSARYRLGSWKSMRSLLKQFIELNKEKT